MGRTCRDEAGNDLPQIKPHVRSQSSGSALHLSILVSLRVEGTVGKGEGGGLAATRSVLFKAPSWGPLSTPAYLWWEVRSGPPRPIAPAQLGPRPCRAQLDKRPLNRRVLRGASAYHPFLPTKSGLEHGLTKCELRNSIKKNQESQEWEHHQYNASSLLVSVLGVEQLIFLLVFLKS